VRVATAVLGVLLVAGSAGIVRAAAQHPNLFVNATELVQLRAKLKATPSPTRRSSSGRSTTRGRRGAANGRAAGAASNSESSTR
jgi:hypothetical protein